MANTLEIELHNRQQAWVAIKSKLFPFLKEVLQNGRRLVLVVKERQRTTPQNRRYWGKGVLAQIAEQAVVNGKQYDAETWHELFKRMFIGVKELPNGEIVGMSSKELSTTEFSDFCAKVEAYAATELGVTFYDLQH
jgi:hypothetical protein